MFTFARNTDDQVLAGELFAILALLQITYYFDTEVVILQLLTFIRYTHVITSKKFQSK